MATNQSSMNAFSEELYDFYLRNRKPQYIIYGITFFITLTFAVVNDLLTGKPEETVVIESIIFGAILLIVISFGYILKLSQSRKLSQSKKPRIQQYNVLYSNDSASIGSEDNSSQKILDTSLYLGLEGRLAQERSLAGWRIRDLKSEIDLISNEIRMLERLKASEEYSLRLAFKKHGYDVPDTISSFSIPEETSLAKTYFAAALAGIILDSLLTTWTLMTMDITPWLALPIAVLLSLVIQAMIILFSDYVNKPTEALQFIKKFALYPSFGLFMLCITVLIIGRMSVVPSSLPISLVSVSLALLSLLLPIMIGAFLAASRILCWSEKAEKRFESIEGNLLRALARRDRLMRELEEWYSIEHSTRASDAEGGVSSTSLKPREA
jgi:hypothetical protein